MPTSDSLVLCCGEALIDMIPAVTAEGEPALTPKTGGSVFNTAIACARLGVNTGFISGVSTDLFGEKLEHALQESGVDTRLMIRSPQPTTLAFVSLRDGQASYTFYDENTAGRALSPTSIPKLPDETRALFFGGISLINPPSADFYARLLEQEATQQLIMIDPNIRPAFVRDKAAYRQRLGRMIKRAHLIKVSDDDLAWLVPEKTRLAEQVQELDTHHNAIVIVTRGQQGAEAYIRGNKMVQIMASPAQVVDTVGAGDTFNAGFLSSLDKAGLLTHSVASDITESQLVNALKTAADAAAITVSRAGANPPWAQELPAQSA